MPCLDLYAARRDSDSPLERLRQPLVFLHTELDMSTEFGRRFGIERLRDVVEGPADHWLKDLLKLWRPSGVPAGESGLRLAIRNGSVNFYRKGQSVACVLAGPRSGLILEIHPKYVMGEGARSISSRLRLLNEDVTVAGGKIVARYGGSETLGAWIREAEKPKYTGSEKPAVDEIVAQNSTVIDLEMGLPAWGELPATGQRKSSRQIDLVALEAAGDAWQLVFWEVKRVDDNRLVSRSQPEVEKQLAVYRDYLSDVDRARQVVVGQREACRLLVEFHRLARAVQPGIVPLDGAILDVASGADLDIDKEPRMAMLIEHGKEPSKARRDHLERLQGVAPLVLFSAGGPLVLPNAREA